MFDGNNHKVMKGDTHFGYFPVNDTAIATGFYLTGAGVERIDPRQSYPLPNHPEMYQFTWNAGRILPEYQLVYLTAGEGEFHSHETGRVRIHWNLFGITAIGIYPCKLLHARSALRRARWNATFARLWEKLCSRS